MITFKEWAFLLGFGFVMYWTGYVFGYKEVPGPNKECPKVTGEIVISTSYTASGHYCTYQRLNKGFIVKVRPV